MSRGQFVPQHLYAVTAASEAVRVPVQGDPAEGVRVELAVVEPYVWIDEPNPRGLPVYHRGGACTDPEGGCRPRVQATCLNCRCDFNLCLPSFAEIKAMMARRWRCGECSEVV